MGDEGIVTLDKASLSRAAKRLAKRDAVLERALSIGGPPSLWKRPCTYATFVRIILEQQVSLASAWNTYNRLVERCGQPSRSGRSEERTPRHSSAVTPAAVIEVGLDGLKALGFSRQKARYASVLAERCQQRQFKIRPLSRLPDAEVRQMIVAELGMGDWTADMYLMLALCRGDIFPIGDLAIVKGFEELSGEQLSGESLAERAEPWRPYRSVAARMIWSAYLEIRQTVLPGA